MSPSTNIRLEAGDRAPSCTGVTAQGAVYASEAQSGRAVVLILAPNLGSPNLLPLLEAFSARADDLAARDVDLVALIGEGVTRVFEFNQTHPSRVTLVGGLDAIVESAGLSGKVPAILIGTPKDFLDQIGFDSETPEVLILDRNQRAAARLTSRATEDMVASAMKVVEALPTEPPRDSCSPAPVVILPNLLDPALCQELIDLHKTGGHSTSPSLIYDDDGHPGHKVDYRLKKRQDFLLERDHAMSLRLTDILKRRCIPEIKRYFQAEVSHMDRFNIACYPGDGGHFRRHRDNRPDLVSFRRFALSINLTSGLDGYEGGFLRLPEFSDHHYRCPTGAGVMFSVALLHEITPVIKGNRYVLVTHLHDEEGEAKWLEMRRTLAARA